MFLCFAAVLCAGLSGCIATEEKTDPIVMTVGSAELHASTVRGYLDAVKESIGSTTDAALEAYVSDRYGQTLDEYWQDLLAYYGKEMAVSERCADLGIEATDDELAEAKESYKDYFGVQSDEEYEESLASLGLTKEEMDIRLSYNVCLKKLYEQEVTVSVPSQAEVQAYADLYRESYKAVRCSVIYKPAGSLSEMQQILAELLQDSSADFSSYARQYSDELAATDADGDSGWMLCVHLSEDFRELLDEMQVGQILDQVRLIDDGLYIIKKTGAYEPEEDETQQVDISLMPDEIYAQLLQDVGDFLWDEQCESYVDDLYARAEVHILITSYDDLPAA